MFTASQFSFIFIPQFQKDLKGKHFYLKADACEVVAVVVAVPVVFVIVVWSWQWQQEAKTCKNPHEMLRKIVAVFGLQNLSEVSESFGKDRGNPEKGIGSE